jgi:hypothetical protein
VGFCYLRQEGCRGTDLRKQSDSEAIKNMQHTVTQILAEVATVEEATPKILQALSEWLGWDVGALWRVDQEAGVLRCVEVGISHPKKSRNLSRRAVRGLSSPA